MLSTTPFSFQTPFVDVSRVIATYLEHARDGREDTCAQIANEVFAVALLPTFEAATLPGWALAWGRSPSATFRRRSQQAPASNILISQNELTDYLKQLKVGSRSLK